jgi:hypothetical protein
MFDPRRGGWRPLLKHGVLIGRMPVTVRRAQACSSAGRAVAIWEQRGTFRYAPVLGPLLWEFGRGGAIPSEPAADPGGDELDRTRG